MSEAMTIPPLSDAPAKRTPTVYFIDDSATMREVIKIAFRRENINVITCADAASALAQFERRLIQERTKAGLASARARGRLDGRRSVDLDGAKVRAARRLHDDHTPTIDDICKTLHISKSTYYRYVQMKKCN